MQTPCTLPLDPPLIQFSITKNAGKILARNFYLETASISKMHMLSASSPGLFPQKMEGKSPGDEVDMLWFSFILGPILCPFVVSGYFNE